MNKVFITGASGFVGKNLLAYLQHNSVTTVPFSRSAGYDYGSIDGVFLNHQQIDTIVHLAGKAHDLRKSVNSEEYYKANTELTRQLFESFLQSNASTFIYISSVKAIADSTDVPLTEEIQPFPLTDYGKSKLAAEAYLLKQLLPTGKRLYILRPCMIHGPGNKGNLNLLYQVVKKGIPYPLVAFDNKRSYLSVENFCFVIYQLTNRKDVPSGIYHVADDEPISTMDVVQMIAAGLGKKGRWWKISPALIRWVARLGDIIPFPLNSERLQKLTDSYVVSNHKLISALKVPLPVNAKEGLQKTIESFKDVD
jgi:nucleoside-diphosphate-sugar epimerase